MPHSTRGGNGRFARDINTAERDAQAATLRARGLTYQRIANELGYSDKTGAYYAVKRALANAVREPAAELQILELDRLDRMYTAALDVLEREHVAISQGRVVRRRVGTERNDDGTERLNDNGEPIPLYQDVHDDTPVLAAIDRLLKIQERRAKLLGLDAPTKHEVITLDAINTEIARLESELGHTGGNPA